ncbi:MAG: hypothetical protein QOD83_2847 [Solirubrobacteraceae bacterium]|nr:hypothetical protein [Solirubrobacteraceae bacterium]
MAIGDKELVSSARNDVRKSLRRDVVRANNERDEARFALDEQQQYIEAAYPILTGGQLRGRTIGLVMLGENKDLPAIIDKALEPTEADLKLVATVRDSVDLEKLSVRARGLRYAGLAQDPSLLDDLGKRIGIQAVKGGKLINDARSELMRSTSGQFGGLDGVIVMRSRSADPAGDKQAAERRDALYDGIARGIAQTGVNSVGIETRDTQPSQVSWYRDRGLSSVDNIDESAGRAALVFVLAGSDGAYGRRDSAQALLPPVIGRVPRR